MRYTYLSLLFAFTLLTVDLAAQTAQTIVVEHFTNTRCGICSSRNPGFYENLWSQPDPVIHIAYHPSAPYSSCVLNQHNKEENDGRTQYYNVYGSTPRLVIQGQTISSGANYSSDALFEPFQDQVTPFGVEVTEAVYDADSVHVTVEVASAGIHNLTELKLYVALAEDTVFYNAPNGEDEHYDVFRKAFTADEGDLVAAPGAVGETVTFSSSVAIDPEWDLSRIYPVAIVQDANVKAVWQAGAGPIVSEMTVGVRDLEISSLSLYPNPTQDRLTWSATLGTVEGVEVFDAQGRGVALRPMQSDQQLDVSHLPQGSYTLRLRTPDGVYVGRFAKL